MKVIKFLSELLLVILSLAIVAFYPIIIGIITALLIYRYAVQIIVKKDPKVIRIISGMDAGNFGKDPYIKPIAMIVPYWISHSKIDKQEVIRVFTEKIVKPKNNNGKCYYPEMMQRIVRKYGYNFWCTNDSFNVEDHIMYINERDPDEPLTKNEMEDMIYGSLTKTPFNPNASPWEILVVRNLIDPDDPNVKSALIFRFHHGLFDGYSAVNFLRRVAVKPWKDLAGEPKYPRLNTCQTIMYYLWLILAGPYQFLKLALYTNDDNKLITTTLNEFKDDVNYHTARIISLKTLKEIKNHFNVSLSSVLYTAVAEAFRRVMDGKNVIPSKVHITIPLFLPEHPDELTNHWTVAKVPVLFQKDDGDLCMKTLRYVDSKYKKLQASLQPLTSRYFSEFLGILPVPLHPATETLIRSTLLITNLPGPVKAFDIFGYDIVDVGCGGRQMRGFGFYASPISYNGFVKIIVGADTSVLPRKKDAIAVAKNIEDIINRWALEMEKKKEKKLED